MDHAMSDLAKDFDPIDPTEWLEAATRGKEVETSTATDEGVDLSWLYTAVADVIPRAADPQLFRRLNPPRLPEVRGALVLRTEKLIPIREILCTFKG